MDSYETTLMNRWRQASDGASQWALNEIERLSAENSLLRDCVDDFISQIADCKSAHTVCGQFTSLAEAIQENLDALYQVGKRHE